MSLLRSTRLDRLGNYRASELTDVASGKRRGLKAEWVIARARYH